MDPNLYTGQEWRLLARQLNARQLRSSLKKAYRREAREAVKMARASLRASGLQVRGNRSDWEKGVRSHVYSRGGGFLVTVKGRASGRSRKELSMHENRRYDRTRRRLPVLMWAEDGTRQRYSGPGKWRYEWQGNAKLAARHGAKYKLRRQRVRTSGLNRGRMPAYHFLDKAAPAMFRTVEAGLLPDVRKGVEETARKCGFT